MNRSRRQFLELIAAAAGLPAASKIALADQYPSRPIHLIVGFAAGNAPDTIARLTGDKLSHRLGQPVVVENRVGAASTIAAHAVATADPDGHTLLQITPANAINPDLRGGLIFADAIMPVASIARGPFIVVVKADSPLKTMADLIREARTTPEKITIGSTGTGSTPYMCAALFKMMTGINALLVPFRGSSQAATEVLSGRTNVAFVDMSANPLVQSGSLRALAVTTSARQGTLPGIPSVAESVPGYEASTWYGIGAPKGTPPDIVERLNREINAGLDDATIKSRLATLGIKLDLGKPDYFGKRIAEETVKWAKVAKFASTHK
jgi:tripartite-type tricarboxylate transporter receptor subunit TctC